MKNAFLLFCCIISFYFAFSQTLDCNSWLSTPSFPSRIDVKQINVSGNQITVEALIKRTTSYSQATDGGGDVVSKHSNTTNCNYLLRPNGASITTSAGFFTTPSICAIELNKTYHVAMVYDGSILKFYRNGFLMSQVAASGNLVQTTWATSIGLYSNASGNTNFIGNINEVRIWNIARSQTLIRENMFSSLLNPTTQTGLLAYYRFGDLLNKQGNPEFNGVISGSAVINVTNSNCAVVYDSCGYIIQPVSCNDFCYWRVNGNTITGNNNIFGTLNNSSIRLLTNSVQRGILTNNGNFGWNVLSPTANFHTNGTVRFENLPSGNGNALVVDNQGNLKVAQSILYRSSNVDYESELNKLKTEIENLKKQVNMLIELNNNANKNLNGNSILYQNNPNPSLGNSIIKYSIGMNFNEAYILIFDNSGRQINKFKLSEKKGALSLNTLSYKPGAYTYVLMLDGTRMDSKKMVVQGQ